jgi:hypothetical protein
MMREDKSHAYLQAGRFGSSDAILYKDGIAEDRLHNIE